MPAVDDLGPKLCRSIIWFAYSPLQEPVFKIRRGRAAFALAIFRCDCLT